MGSFRTAMAFVGGLALLEPSISLAGFIAFTDQTTWETAAGPPTATEDFNGFSGDMILLPPPVSLNGMTVQASPGTDFNFSIDVPPFFGPSQDIDGTPKASGRVSDFAPLSLNETWQIQFLAPVTAWGADFRNAGDPPNGNLMIEVFDENNSLLGTLVADASSDVEFLGFQLTVGQRADHLLFTAPGGVDGFDIDNIALVSQVPEPSGLALAGIGTLTLLAHAGWRRKRAGALHAKCCGFRPKVNATIGAG